MKVTELLHTSILVSNLIKSRNFYEGVLKLTPSSSRPEMSFNGVWYEIGAQQIHLLVLPNPDPVTGRPEHGGRDRHLALGVENLEQAKQALEQAGIPFTMSRSGRPALFCRDPDGNALELVVNP
jgi:glyoxylase I family protein